MAPRKKQREETDSAPAAAVTTRVTRSSTRRPNTTVPPAPAAKPEAPKRKKAKTTTPSAASEEEGETEAPPSPVEKETEIQEPASETEVQEPVSEPEIVDGSRTIIIEHCKQCNSFKTRAIQVKNGLEKGAAGVNVVVNPEKPRKGCFEIREKDGEIFVSLLDMKRPFKPMKDLDMEKVISDIVEKIG